MTIAITRSDLASHEALGIAADVLDRAPSRPVADREACELPCLNGPPGDTHQRTRLEPAMSGDTLTVEIESVVLATIAIDAGTQVRAALAERVVTEYAERMAEGATFPPVVLFHDGNRSYLADGFHRVMAAQRNGLAEVTAEVRAGTQADALWYALGANRANAHQMTPADKKHAILVALKTWPDRSEREIAEQVGCSKTYVHNLKPQVVTADQVPERVTGKDGKSYPASRPKLEDGAFRKAALSAELQQAAARLEAGETIERVQKATGLGRDQVSRLRKNLGAGHDRSKGAVARRRKDIAALAARGFSSHQIAGQLGIGQARVQVVASEAGIVIHADRLVGKMRRHGAKRIVGQMAMDAEHLTADVSLIEFGDLDPADLPGWIASFQQSAQALKAFIRRLIEEQKKHGHQGTTGSALVSVVPCCQLDDGDDRLDRLGAEVGQPDSESAPPSLPRRGRQ